MSAEGEYNMCKLKMSSGASLEFECAAKNFKRRPELVIKSNGEVVATIWQIGHLEFFYGPGKKKVTAKTGTYLGTMKVNENGTFDFLLCDPRQRTTHNPERVKLKKLEYVTALVAAYGTYYELFMAREKAA
jgi:hypothetical protein